LLTTIVLPRLVIGRAESLITTQWKWLVPAVALGWLVWSLVLAARLYRAHTALTRARRTWRWAKIDDVDVLVSGDVGPAALGVASRAIVVPEWALLLPAQAREVIVRHERSHVDSGDTILLLAAQVAVALQPWNIALRLATHRLRLAVELDCDARVIALGVDRSTYERSLLDIARYAGATSQLLATLSEPFDQLHARIVAMSAHRRPRPLIAASFAALAAVAFVAACNSERGSSPRVTQHVAPNDSKATPSIVARRETLSVLHLPNVTSSAARRLGDAPVGGDKARALLADHPVRALDNGIAPVYPPTMRAQRVEGEVLVMFVVDTTGRADITSLKVVKATAPEFVDAVRTAIPQMEFDPARLNGRKVRQLTQLPFTFALAPLERRRG
jgi:TonB family protein